MAQKLIKESPEYGIVEGPGATAPRVQSSGISSRGAAQARDISVPNIDAGQGGYNALIRGIEDIKGAMAPFARAKYLALETGRKARVILQGPKLAERFNTWKDEQIALGENAGDLTQKLTESYEELLNDFLTSSDIEWDDESKLDLTNDFNSQFMKTMVWAESRELNMAKRAADSAMTLVVNNSNEEALRLDLGDTVSIDLLARDIADKRAEIYGEQLSEESYNQTYEQAREQLTRVAFTRWLNHDPSNARKLWTGRPEYFKSVLKSEGSWNAMNQKVENMKDEALEDETYKYLMLKNGKNFQASAEIMLDQEFLESRGLTYASAMKLRGTFLAEMDRLVAAENKRKGLLEDATYDKIVKSNYNPDGSFNYSRASAMVVIAQREGMISGDKALAATENWKQSIWTPDNGRNLMNWIDGELAGGRTPSNFDIISKTWGEVDANKYIKYRDDSRSTIEKYGNTTDSLKYAEDKVRAEANALNDPKEKNEMLQQLPDFLERIKDFMAIEGLNKFDPRVREEVRKQFEKVAKVRSTGEIVPESEMEWFRREEGPKLRFMWGEPLPEITPPEVLSEGIFVDNSTLSPEVLEILGGPGGKYTQEEVDIVVNGLRGAP